MAKGCFPLAVAKIPYEQSNFSLASFLSFPLYPSASSEGRDDSLQRQRCEGISTRFLQGPWGSAAPFSGSFYAQGSSPAPRKCQANGQRTQGTAPGGAGCWPQQVKQGPEGCSWCTSSATSRAGSCPFLPQQTGAQPPLQPQSLSSSGCS